MEKDQFLNGCIAAGCDYLKHRHAMHARVMFLGVGELLETVSDVQLLTK